MKHIFEGGLWEDSKFTIETNYKLGDYDIKCKHVVDDKLPKGVVIAINEGGYNSTGVCVECLIEALKELKLI
jgi:hypothetical protein